MVKAFGLRDIGDEVVIVGIPESVEPLVLSELRECVRCGGMLWVSRQMLHQIGEPDKFLCVSCMNSMLKEEEENVQKAYV